MLMKNDGTLIFQAFDKIFFEEDESVEAKLYLVVPEKICGFCSFHNEENINGAKEAMCRHCHDTHFLFCGSYKVS